VPGSLRFAGAHWRGGLRSMPGKCHQGQAGNQANAANEQEQFRVCEPTILQGHGDKCFSASSVRLNSFGGQDLFFRFHKN
jgi:hypothetical protein